MKTYTINGKDYNFKKDSLGLGLYKRKECKKWITMDIMPGKLMTEKQILYHIKEHTFFADKVLKLEMRNK